MKYGPRVALLVLALIASLLASGFAPPRWLERDGAETALAPSEVRARQAQRPPAITARHAVVLDAASEAVLYARGADERVAPASLTKMMTALVAIERAPLQQKIVATPNVYVEPVVIGLDPGESMSLEDLLYGLLLTSGNDAGVAIAEGLAGSVPRFADLMNQRAAELGLRGTRFRNPHGLDEDGHYSTAIDLARLTAAMMRNPTAARMVATRVHTVPGPPLYQFRSSNPLLGVVEGVDGGKTGFTDLAGRCLAVTAVRGGNRVVAVVLDSQNIAADGQALLEYAFASHEWTEVAPQAWRLLEYRQDRERRQAHAARAVVPVPVWETAAPRLRVVFDQAAAQTSGVVGRLLVASPLRRLGEFPLLAGTGAR